MLITLKILATLIVLTFTNFNLLQAQWNPTSATSISDIYRDGNVAIGNYSTNFGINNYGIGRLEVLNTSSTIWNMYITNGSGSAKGLRIKGGFYNNPAPLLQVEANSGTSNPNTEDNIRLLVLADGRVGIGTASPQVQLDVVGDFQVRNTSGVIQFKVINSTPGREGWVRAREMQLDLGTIPDYVFEPNYNLMPLAELKKYLIINKHLPNIPSATEYENAGGVNVGELQLKLLLKVEELSLYILQQQEEIEALKLQINK